MRPPVEVYGVRRGRFGVSGLPRAQGQEEVRPERVQVRPGHPGRTGGVTGKVEGLHGAAIAGGLNKKAERIVNCNWYFDLPRNRAGKLGNYSIFFPPEHSVHGRK